jgi:hypothetical protein
MRTFTFLVIGICVVLLILKPLQYSIFILLGSTFSGIAIGILFTIVSIVITSNVSAIPEYDESSRIKVMLAYVFLEAIIFALVGSISLGHVYGIDFTLTGNSPLYAVNGEISIIAICGGLNGIFLAYSFLIDFGFSKGNGCGYAALIWVLLLGGFFAIALSGLSGAPFIAAAYFSRAIMGFIISKVILSATILRQLSALTLSFLLFAALIMK